MGAQHEVGTADGFLSPRRESRPIHRGVFTIVALALLMMSIDSTIVATALHSLRTGLQTSIDLAGWAITAYSLGFVVILPISGKLSERYGCRKVFLGSVVAFTIASLCCGLAESSVPERFSREASFPPPCRLLICRSEERQHCDRCRHRAPFAWVRPSAAHGDRHSPRHFPAGGFLRSRRNNTFPMSIALPPSHMG
jgi:Major Facilitator Superfamily